MKKFLAILLTLIVTVALGFTVFYLVKDNEVIYLSTSSVFVSKGDKFNVDINFKNKKSYTDYEIIIDKNDVVNFDKENNEFTALTGGYTNILFRTSNVNYRNLNCVVYVGDGLTKSTPFYISTAEQLSMIGKVDDKGVTKYPLNAFYTLRNDIDMADLAESNLGYWTPIGHDLVEGTDSEFVGHFDGRGYSIKNLNIDKNAYNNEVDKSSLKLPKQNFLNAGLFAKLGVGAEVKDIKFENANITGAYKYAGLVTAIANSSKIERVEVKSLSLNLENTEVAGGLVGQMNSTLDNKLYVTSSIDRVGVNFTLNSMSQLFGGIVGQNNGGYVVYSFAKGEAETYNNYNTNVYFGGLIGDNKYLINNVEGQILKIGAHLKDSYSYIELKYTIPENGKNNLNKLNIGLLISRDYSDVETKIYGDQEIKSSINRIIGNYYSKANNSIGLETEVKNYKGVNASYDKNSLITKNECDYYVKGLNDEEFVNKDSFKSHVHEEKGITNVILWKENVWIFTNGNLPQLDYSEQSVSTDLYTMADGVKVETAEQLMNKLKNYKVDEPIVISKDIDFTGKTWEPIGTKDEPFQGKIFVDYVLDENDNKIYNKLKNITTGTVIEVPMPYASLFGYLGKEAEIHNLVVENSKFTNGIESAAIAYVNEGTIEDVLVNNCEIIGTKNAAGIAITNSGKISQYVITNGDKEAIYGPGVVVKNTKISVENSATEDCAVAGIAVLNTSSIDGVIVVGYESGYIKANIDDTSNVIMGGIVSVNEGTIKNSNISFLANNEGIIANSSANAKAGGIAAINKKVIERTFVSTNISVSTTNENAVAAGLVAQSMLDSNLSKSGFYSNLKVIKGYNATGVAFELNNQATRKFSFQGWNAFWGSAVLKTTKADMGDGIQESFVSGKTTITGKKVSGLINTIGNGAVIDSYIGTGVTLKGIDESSEVANIVFNVKNASYDKNGAMSVGLIAYCYSDAKIMNSGKNYGVAKDDIIQTPTGSYDKLESGFGVSLFVSEENTKDCTFYGQYWPITNWGKNGQGNCKTNNDDLYSVNDTKKYENYGFDDKIWAFNENEFSGATTDIAPSLKNAKIDLNRLEID